MAESGFLHREATFDGTSLAGDAKRAILRALAVAPLWPAGELKCYWQLIVSVTGQQRSLR